MTSERQLEFQFMEDFRREDRIKFSLRDLFHLTTSVAVGIAGFHITMKYLPQLFDADVYAGDKADIQSLLVFEGIYGSLVGAAYSLGRFFRRGN